MINVVVVTAHKKNSTNAVCRIKWQTHPENTLIFHTKYVTNKANYYILRGQILQMW